MLLNSSPFILHNAMRSVRWAFIILLYNSTGHHQLNRTPPTSASVGNHLSLGGWLVVAVCCNIFAMECWISVSYFTGTLLIVELKLTPYDGAGAFTLYSS